MEVYSRPYDESYPVVCMDEKPVQFFADFRKGFRSKKDGVQYEDYQYIRNGTASIFLFTEPLAGWRYADAQERRTAHDWAKQIEWLLTEQYPVAKRVVLVMDNLNTHSIASLYATFPPQHARELAERLEIHYTPKHGIIVFLAILCGVGGSVMMGIARGEGKTEKGNACFTVACLLMTIITVVSWLALLTCTEPIFRLFGANDEVIKQSVTH